MNDRGRGVCLYYGAAITDRAKRERNLPLINPATTNRMLRIASAFMAAGEQCAILSPAIMPRIPTTMARLPRIAQRVSGVPVLSISQLGVRFAGYMLSPFTALASAVRLAKRRRIKTVVQYCYFPDAFIFSLWCKIAYGSKVVLDLEDICQPRIADWKRGSETRPLLQLWGWVLMKLSIRLANVVIMPTKKFSSVVPERKRLVVSGCQKVVEDVRSKLQGGKMHFLYSGGITEENGIVLLMDALKILDDQKRNFQVSICGMGARKDWARQKAGELRNVEVEVLGFLGNEDFNNLYKKIDICFALQKPTGRHGQFKTPSKGYEAMCSGKALVVSDIGDFGELPDTVCYHVRPYAAKKLAEILGGLTREGLANTAKAALEYSKANFDSSIVGRRIVSYLR